MSSAAVDSATAQMANTTLSEGTPNAAGASIGEGGSEPINASQNEAVIQSAAEGRRLYIGNLAYAATEGDLKELFKDYLTEAVSIPINPRTTRPVGYAFVDVSTSTEAERAITELKGKTILDRGISIQLARTPQEGKTNGEAGEGKPARRESGRTKSRPRARGSRKPKTAEDGTAVVDGDGPTNVPGQATDLTGTTKEALTSDKGAVDTVAAATKTQEPRQRRQRGPPEDGVPSKTKIMVANLPYDLREEKLMELFAAYEPTSAKLALRPIPRFMIKKLQARNEPRKGRGFAFVSMASEEMQQKAIADMNGKEIEGRELAVKVAIDSPGKEDELDAPGDPAAAGKENGYPSTAEGSANTSATVAAS